MSENALAYAKERPIEYTFGDKKDWKVSFNIEVQTFMPIFKNEENGFLGAANTEFEADNVIQEFQSSVNFAQPGGIESLSPFADDDTNGPNQAGTQVDPTNTDNRGGYGPAWPVTRSTTYPPNGGATQS